MEGITVVREVMENLKVAADSPECLLEADVDCFGNPLVGDATMAALREGVARDKNSHYDEVLPDSYC